MSIEDQLNALFAPPEAAIEVVTLDRATVETILNELEATDPLRSLVSDLRAKLAEPKVELWAMFTIGANEIYPARDRAHADFMYADLMAACAREKQRMIDAGENMEYWQDWRAVIIPSPFEPAEHFELLAGEALDEEARIRKLWSKCDDDRSKLLSAVGEVLENREEGGDLARNFMAVGALSKLGRTVFEVTAEDRARQKRLEELRTGTNAAEQKHQKNLEELRAKNAQAPCSVPPSGWACSRESGHEGPCASSPIT